MYVISRKALRKFGMKHLDSQSSLTRKDYDRAVKRLNQLLYEVGVNEDHPLYELLDTLGTVIHAYEERHYPFPDSSGAEMLRFFMEEHGLDPADLSEFGSPGIV